MRSQSRRIGVALVASSSVAASFYIRRWREEKLVDLCHNFPLDEIKRTRDNIDSVIQLGERAALMGYQRNVEHELDDIRTWHRARGFLGGIILRELDAPLFTTADANDKSDTPKSSHTQTSREERNCYYLYYELTGAGHVKQQIFCRGTTLLSDVLTDLKSVYVWDEELKCTVHMGFRDHANRLLEDLEPLLADRSDRRSTVELCGHSLGGAVALLVLVHRICPRHTHASRITSAQPAGRGEVEDAGLPRSPRHELRRPEAVRLEGRNGRRPLAPRRAEGGARPGRGDAPAPRGVHRGGQALAPGRPRGVGLLRARRRAGDPAASFVGRGARHGTVVGGVVLRELSCVRNGGLHRNIPPNTVIHGAPREAFYQVT